MIEKPNLKSLKEQIDEYTKDYRLPVHRQAVDEILHAVRYTDQGTSVDSVSEYL